MGSEGKEKWEERKQLFQNELPHKRMELHLKTSVSVHRRDDILK